MTNRKEQETMIKLYCDICGAEKASWQIIGVRHAVDESIYLTGNNAQFGETIEQCKKHICKDCLEKIGWSEKETEEVTK